MNLHALKIPLIAGILFSLFIGGCYETEKNLVSDQERWSNLEPLSIPYRLRDKQHQAGNLVINHSFENGRYFRDSVLNTFRLKNWTVHGDQSVHWVDTAQKKYTSEEVTHGRYGIKINKTRADETSKQGKGIISDFIKVIPGNYQLSFDLKLKNIVPNQARLGTRLYETVNIRILFYDKNKLEIDNREYYPLEDKMIDLSFQAYPLSNYWEVKNSGWFRMNGINHHHPFITGDIPNKARYVKLLFALKGKGEMWVDNIDFRFTRLNFSSLERMRYFFKTDFDLTELLVPQPQNIHPKRPLRFFNPEEDSAQTPVIIIPKNASHTTMKAAEMLQKKLNNLIAASKPDHHQQVKMTSEINRQLIHSDTYLFSIGKNKLSRQYKKRLPLDKIKGKDQGYIIHHIKDKYNMIFVSGNNQVGDYYGTSTLIQLIDSDFVFHNATIIDYPDFINRAFTINHNTLNRFDSASYSEAIDYINHYKMNSLVLNCNKEKHFQSSLEKIRYYSRGPLRYFATMHSPYRHFPKRSSVDSLNEAIKQKWLHSSKQDVINFSNQCKKAINYGSEALFIMSHPYYPHQQCNNSQFRLYTQQDKEQFHSLSEAHSYLLKKINQKINKPGSDHIPVNFIPPWSNQKSMNQSRGQAELYFEKLKENIPYDISYLWSGAASHTFFLDEAEIMHFQKTTGKKPIYWDHSLYADEGFSTPRYHKSYPGKVRLDNFMGPYEVHFSGNLNHHLDSSWFILHMIPTGFTDLIKLLTAADFLWNTSGYDPSLSLWKTLLYLFDQKAAEELIRFNNYFFQLKEWQLIQQKIKLTRKDIRQITGIKKDLDNSYQKLQSLIDNEMFLDEIKQMKAKLVGSFTLF